MTYLVGSLMETSQFTLKAAYRVASLYETGKLMDFYTRSGAMLSQAEARAKEMMEADEFKGSEGQLASLADKGISRKDFATLSKVLRKRDYVVSFFFVRNGSLIAREDPAIYESIIAELNEDIDRSRKLLASLSKTADKLRLSYQA